MSKQDVIAGKLDLEVVLRRFTNKDGTKQQSTITVAQPFERHDLLVLLLNTYLGEARQFLDEHDRNCLGCDSYLFHRDIVLSINSHYNTLAAMRGGIK